MSTGKLATRPAGEELITGEQLLRGMLDKPHVVAEPTEFEALLQKPAVKPCRRKLICRSCGKPGGGCNPVEVTEEERPELFLDEGA